METEAEAPRSGRDDAAEDIAAGRLRYFWDIRGGWGRFCQDLMRSRFGVEIESTSCFVNRELSAYRAAYNSIIAAHVDQLFGHDAFGKACSEVEKFREQQYADHFERKREAK